MKESTTPGDRAGGAARSSSIRHDRGGLRNPVSHAKHKAEPSSRHFGTKPKPLLTFA